MVLRGPQASPLPAYFSQAGLPGYSKLYKPRRHDQSGVPWRLLLILCAALGGLYYTFHHSSKSEAVLATRLAAYDRLASLSSRRGADGEPEELVPRRKWSERHVRTILEDEDAARRLAGRDRPRNEFAAYDPLLHAQYLDLPPLSPPSEAEMTGSFQLTEAVYNQAARHPAARVLSFEHPRVVHFPSFLSPEEVQHIFDISREHLVRSEVVHEEGEESVSNIRTSFGVWPSRTAVTQNITDRIHRLLGVPHDFGEDLYVLQYKHGQQYDAHNDNCMDDLRHGRTATPSCVDFLKRAGGPQCGPGAGGVTCGDRMATFILQLKHPDKGGHTVFPAASITKAAMKRRKIAQGDEWYCDEDAVLGAAPAAGDALLFW